jgi:anti-anti-sigma factor
MASLRALDRADELAPGDHASWMYDERSDLRATCTDFLAEGIRQGERLMYVGSGTLDLLLDDLAGLPDRHRLIDAGQLSVHTAREMYGFGAVEPHDQVEKMLQHSRDAAAEGYTGLRILGDVSDFAVEPALMQAVLEYEAAIDVAPATTLTTAICALDRSRTHDSWRLFSALHRQQYAPGWCPGFAIQAGDGVIRLAGDVDLSCSADLQEVLMRLGATAHRELVIDLHELAFIDVAGTRALAAFREAMAQSGRSVRFTGLGPAARRTFPIFELSEGLP